MAKRQPKKVSMNTTKLSLFDHIANLTIKKTEWEKYSETDMKTFEPFMINRFLSMDYNLIELVNMFQKFTIGSMDKREVFKLYSGLLPKKKYFLRYVKSKSDGTYSAELLEYMAKYFQCSKSDCVDYLNIYYKNEVGIQEVSDILKKYGIEEKKVKKMLVLR